MQYSTSQLWKNNKVKAYLEVFCIFLHAADEALRGADIISQNKIKVATAWLLLGLGVFLKDIFHRKIIRLFDMIQDDLSSTEQKKSSSYTSLRLSRHE